MCSSKWQTTGAWVFILFYYKSESSFFIEYSSQALFDATIWSLKDNFRAIVDDDLLNNIVGRIFVSSRALSSFLFRFFLFPREIDDSNKRASSEIVGRLVRLSHMLLVNRLLSAAIFSAISCTYSRLDREREGRIVRTHKFYSQILPRTLLFRSFINANRAVLQPFKNWHRNTRDTCYLLRLTSLFSRQWSFQLKIIGAGKLLSSCELLL